MKASVIALTLIALFFAPAAAQYGGAIGLYSDVGYLDCQLTETLFAVNTVYVVHNFVATANTSRFMIQNNWPNAIVGGVNFYSSLTLGDLFTGITITYVGCKTLPHLLASVDFIPTSATPFCYPALTVVADPVVPSGRIEVIDCDTNVLYGDGLQLLVNGDWAQCPCIYDIATEETNWGNLKALYR